MKVIHRLAVGLCTACALVIPSPAQALEHVDNWAQPGVKAAQRAGLEPAAMADAEATAPITRAEFAAVALAAYEAVTGQQAAQEAGTPFPDCDDPAVTAASRLGLVSGRSDGTFAPDATINRQELCVMLSSVAKAAGRSVDPVGDLSHFPDAGTVDWWALEAMTVMNDLGIMSGVSTYGALTLEPFGTAARQQALLLSGRFVEVFSDTSLLAGVPEREPLEEETPLPEDAPLPLFPVRGDGFTSDFPTDEEEKTRLVFGDTVTYFQTEEEAEAAMETLVIPIWQLSEDGCKTSSKTKLIVHASSAPIVQQIFQEIYEGDEQFPIKNIGGYGWRSSERSEHRWGTAIDINWEENFEASIGEDGKLTATVGEYWKPGEDPYSIPASGEVVRIFKKYGFSWGGDAWSSKRDYMHFSYFGH